MEIYPSEAGEMLKWVSDAIVYKNASKKIRGFLKFFLFLFPQELTDFGQEKNIS